METQGRFSYPLPWMNWIKTVRVNRESLRAAWRNSRSVLALWLIFVVFMALVQFSSPDLPDNDGYYHIKMAYLMRTEGLKPEFTWLPLSILNAREYYDHHFLFHVLLIPFTLGDLLLGAKLSVVLFSSLAFLGVWKLFKNQNVPYAFWWTLGLMAISEAFIYRMSITRAQSLSLLVLLLGLDWLLRKKYMHLAGLAFVYVWLYDAFPLLFIFAGVFVVASWMIERKLNLLPLVSVSAGILLGLIINPYFPYNILFAVQHIFPKLIEATSVSVGNEWYPYTTAQLLQNSPLALIAFVSGAMALGLSGQRMDVKTLVAFLLAGLFGLMLFQARRFVEYFPPFALIFAAFAWGPMAKGVAFRVLGRSIHWMGVVLVVVMLVGGGWTLREARSSLQDSKPHQTYADASRWLLENTKPGARVFQTDWDDFPRLFYYNTHNTYLIGLDPTYMLLYDEEMYGLWVAITQGEVDRPSVAIQGQFGSEFVVSDLRHEDFLRIAENDPGLVEQFRDEYAVVYQVIVKPAE